MGSLARGKDASITYTLIDTANNGLDLQAWLTEVLHCIAEHPSNRIDALLFWNRKPNSALSDAAWACKGGSTGRSRLSRLLLRKHRRRSHFRIEGDYIEKYPDSL